MPALVTKKFRSQTAEKFLEAISQGISRFYIFVGKASSFADDNNPPAPTTSIQNVEFDIYRDMIAMKRVQTADASLVVPRYNWTSGNVYKLYSDRDATIFTETFVPSSNATFYVVTEDNNVYKCIDNNRSGASTVKPTGTTPSIITTNDNYRWKFLYKITAADSLRFVTTNYIPVRTLTANDGSAQWASQQAAANGSINHIVITANGSNYLSVTNTFAAISNSTVVTLNAPSATDDIYKNATLYISSGLGSGQLRRITQYVGATKRATVNGAFTTTPNTSSSYILGPNVLILGDSGSTAATRATAYVSNCAGGQIRKITLVSTGFNYSTANVVIIGAQGAGAIAYPIISPPGGHGADPANELGASSVMVNTRIIGNESNTFPSNNNFRTIGILRDPKLRSGAFASAPSIDQCMRLGVSGVTGDFTADEIIVGSTSGVRAQFIRFDPDNNKRLGVLRVNRVTTGGTGLVFSIGETVTGQTSGKTAVITSVTKAAVREYTGEILYVENRTPITRTSDQIEDLKIVVRF